MAAKAVNEARLEADRVAKTFKDEETRAIAALQEAMAAAGLRDLAFESVRVTVTEKPKPYISDFSALEGYIREHGALDLLQKRLTESAVKLRWEDGVQIPGVGVMIEQKLTIK
jgi:hypothetical protein